MVRRLMFQTGVLCMALVSLAQAQEGRARFGFGGQGPGMFGMGSAGLLAMPEVQKELGISDEQKGLIEDMMADLREQGRSLFGNFQDFQNLNQEDRQKRMDEVRKKGEEIAKKSEEMVNMILEPKQADRLLQLRHQQEGVRAFNRDDVAKKLELTQEQRDKIRKIQEAARPDRGGGGFADFRNMSEEERREFFTKMREQAEKTNAEILDVLTPAQKENWAKMQGKKFEFPQFNFGQGRRPGGDR